MARPAAPNFWRNYRSPLSWRCEITKHTSILLQQMKKWRNLKGIVICTFFFFWKIGRYVTMLIIHVHFPDSSFPVVLLKTWIFVSKTDSTNYRRNSLSFFSNWKNIFRFILRRKYFVVSSEICWYFYCNYAMCLMCLSKDTYKNWINAEIVVF